MCDGPPKKITNANGPTGNGSLEGDFGNFTCTGIYMWSDGVRGAKASRCENGTWTEVGETCSRLLIISYYTFIYTCIVPS